jgi:membrane dipeptidase
LKIICGIQHCPVDPKNMYDVFRLQNAGIRIMQMTFGEATPFCGGMGDKMGLTGAGYQLLESMAENKMILDLSHAGSAAAVNMVTGEQKDLKILVSHTACRSLYDHPRNLPDDVLKAVADRGGIIGVYAVTFFLHKKDNGIKPMIDHIRHLIKVAGEDAVAIGSDGLVAGYPNCRDWIIHFDWMKKKLDPDGKLGVRWPDQPLELRGSDRFPIIAVALKKRGIKQSVADKILGENAFSFFREALP